MKPRFISLAMVIILSIAAGLGLAIIKNNTDKQKVTPVVNTGYTINCTDFYGKRMVLNKKPERIVVLSQSTCELLYELGINNYIVGVSEEINYPVNLNKTKVGKYNNLKIDAIKALSPDIVFTSKYVYQSDIEELNSLGIPTLYIEPDSYNRIFESLALLGNIFQIKNNSDRISQNIKNRVQEIKAKNLNPSKPNIAYIQSINPLFVGGNNILINDIISMSGGINAFSDVEGFYKIDKLEDRQIDIIIIPNSIMKEYGVNYFKTHNAFKDLSAVKNNKIMTVSDESIYLNGSSRVIKAIEEVTNQIQVPNKR